MSVRRSAAASQDIDEIWLHVAQDSLDAADKLVERIAEATTPLADFPDMGAPRDDLAPGVRMLAAWPYLIFYRHRGTDVVDERVLHGRRDIGRHDL